MPRCSASPTRSASASRSCCSPLGFGWATRSVTFLKRHIRTVNIVGGALLVALGVLMVTGVWTDVMARLGAVIGSVELPL